MNRVHPAYGRMGTVHKLTAGAASTETAAFGAQTYAVRIASGDNGFYFRVGKGAQTAVNTDSVCPGAWSEYIVVHPGEQLAVLRSGASDAIVTVTEITA